MFAGVPSDSDVRIRVGCKILRASGSDTSPNRLFPSTPRLCAPGSGSFLPGHLQLTPGQKKAPPGGGADVGMGGEAAFCEGRASIWTVTRTYNFCAFFIFDSRECDGALPTAVLLWLGRSTRRRSAGANQRARRAGRAGGCFLRSCSAPSGS